MKPASFDFLCPDTLDEALSALTEAGGDARIIAGGQSLVPMLNMRLARPGVLIDIMRLEALRRIETSGDEITVGAGVRQAELEAWPVLLRDLPLLAAAFPWIGHVQTRARGTVCGSMAHADPSAELPLSLVTLGGAVSLRGRKQKRKVKADDFFIGMMATDLAESEMIEAVHFPKAMPGSGYAFREIGRRHGDFAIVACAAVADDTGLRLGIAGVDDRPRVFALPALDDGQFDDALNDIAWSLNARDDIHASARYRRELVRNLGRETLKEASRCRV
ncbi:MAG: FAD binding domain-containing protein [Alphaproteobacteria bacterium]|nr:FAD binding domain-containing protein [Alphaproteobacteria bacterium]MBU1549575.1 FAD binding domain-containing protein [Alphaproteobacteria bacterium]MBU2336430.1 FAD binding domain-containing protein [Alphaproteobacteria bacterium]MBU2387689.1 FAD binding domain-containing protein [Alphaproteobacteria bacterium]